MASITDEINKLNLSSTLKKKLLSNNFRTINDVWLLKRKDLKNLGFSDCEINSIIISLQLEGLDLNKKIYDK